MPNAIWQHCPNSCYNPVTRNQLDCRHHTSSSHSFFLSLPLSRLLQFKKFPIGSACCIRFERKFFMDASDAKAKSVQTSLPDCPTTAAVDRRRGEIDRQTTETPTTTWAITANKSSQLIVCAAVKVCVRVQVGNKYNFLQLQCDLRECVCVCLSLWVLIECNIENIIEIEK